MDSTSHADVSSSHTAKVQSSPGKVEALTFLKISEFQRPLNLFLLLRFSMLIAPSFLSHTVVSMSNAHRSLLIFWKVSPSRPCISLRCFKESLAEAPSPHQNHWGLPAFCPRPLSQPPVSRGFGASEKTSHIPFISLLISCYQAQKKQGK